MLALLVGGCAAPLLRPGPDDSPIHAPAVSLSERHALCAGEPVAPRADASAFLRTALRSGARAGVASTGRPAPGGGKVPHVLLIPLEFETDGGASNGNATFLRLVPAYEWPRRRHWRIQHVDLITLADAPGGVPGTPGNPEPVPGARARGLGDLVHVSLFAPRTSGSLFWGVGAGVGLPTATEEVLGSGKWSAGPAFRITWRKGPWNIGALCLQRWSFAGDADRADTSQLLVRGTVRRELSDDWFLIYSPIITANWHAASGQRWLVPVGGGLGRAFKLGGIGWTASVQGYANVIRPDGGQTWSARLTLTAVVPLGR